MLSSILRQCLFTSSNKPHVWATTPLLSWSCSQECFLQPLLWGVKVALEPGVLKDHYTSSANAAADIPPWDFHTASSPGHFRSLHLWIQAAAPTGTCAMASQSRDGSLGQSQKSPGTWKERCQSTRHSSNCSLNGTGTRGKNNLCETWGQSILCQRSLSHRAMF